MVANVKDKAVIVGIGNTEFSKNSGVSELSLAVQAIKIALDDAGLKPTDIDGMVTFTMDTSDEIEVARALGVGHEPPPALLMGRHILDLGVPPGPRVGEILKAVYEKQLDGSVKSVADGIAEARRLLASQSRVS